MDTSVLFERKPEVERPVIADEPRDPPFLRSAFNYDMNAASEASALYTEPDAPSRTVQSAKDDADINVIVKRFGLTGAMPQNLRLPQYGDYTGINDFHSAMNVVRQAQETFMELPADVRARFGNDPQAFLEFASDPENFKELVKMGLATQSEDVTLETPKSEGSSNVNVSSGTNTGDAATGKSGEVAKS